MDLNQTVWPLSLMIIGPSWPRPAFGARNTRPGARPGLAVVTVTDGGSRSGRVAYFWTVPRPTFGNSTGRALRVVSSPMLISKSPLVAPTTLRSVLTETFSLATNALVRDEARALPVGVGDQLAGVAAAARAAHGDRADRVGVPPRNEIVVFSPAVSVPGTG